MVSSECPFPQVAYRRTEYFLSLFCALVFCSSAVWLAAAEKTASARASEVRPQTIDLAGSWKFSLGNPEPSFPIGELPPELTWSDQIQLPGTTETRGKGPLNPARELGMLTRVRKFEGAAWYQREVEIPASWANQAVTLFLERTKFTQVWWDGKPLGEQRLLTVPHRYAVAGETKPGRHTVTVMVDNREARRLYAADAHQYSDNTQTNWNGMIGRIELQAESPVEIADVQIYSHLEPRSFEVRVKIRNASTGKTSAKVDVRAASWNHEGAAHRPAAMTQEVAISTGESVATLFYLLGSDAKLWDEFSPALYRVQVGLTVNGQRIERVVETGLREFGRKGTQLSINGRTIFLRGKHDGCVFPLTGHPPMDVEGWLVYLRKCQEYGINHIRCHTWVPPEAAFAAADRLGMYLQPELPFWGTFDGKIQDALMPEAESLLREYGNHPSFAMMTLGNEIGGDRSMMNTMVQHLRSLDARHLYADGSNNVLWNPEMQATNDFWSSAKAKTPKSGDRQFPARGSFYFMDGYDGFVQWGEANTLTDLRAANEGVSVPLIGHEIGQYTVYPNYAEISKYKGVVQARNLETFRDRLAARGMSAQAADFFHASGVLAASLYKEELELALRTPGFGGFQILDLQDFPGQGTALVGILDAFMDSKNLITAEQWRSFCSPVVPLARFERYTWTTDETYIADIEVAHYGAADLRDAKVSWSLRSPEGRDIAQGSFKPAPLVQGGLRSVGRIEASLKGAKSPARYELQVVVTDGSQRYKNQWPLWVYSKENDAKPSGASMSIVRDYAAAKPLLEQGKSVVLIPEGKTLGYTVRGAYATDFWCWPMFNSSPGTMGLLCEPRHEALASFPTAIHSERQWSRIVHASTPAILTDLPGDLRPIVQVIDNLSRNEKIGLIFEGRVGERGKLLVCAVDLYSLKEYPEARQLLASLTRYAGSRAFSPKVALPPQGLERLLRPSLAEGKAVTVSSSHQPAWGEIPKPEAAVDADINTRWISKEGDVAPWIAVDLGQRRPVEAVQILWDLDAAPPYLVEASEDGSRWTTLLDETKASFPSNRHTLAVPGEARRPWQHLRVRVPDLATGKKVSIRDLRIW